MGNKCGVGWVGGWGTAIKARMKKNRMMANPPASTGEMTQDRHCEEEQGCGGLVGGVIIGS